MVLLAFQLSLLTLERFLPKHLGKSTFLTKSVNGREGKAILLNEKQSGVSRLWDHYDKRQKTKWRPAGGINDCEMRLLPDCVTTHNGCGSAKQELREVPNVCYVEEAAFSAKLFA